MLEKPAQLKKQVSFFLIRESFINMFFLYIYVNECDWTKKIRVKNAI